MNNTFLETAPVQYNPSAIKTLHTSHPAHKKIFPLHWHERMELLRIKEGTLFIEDGINTISASENEIIIIPPKMLHKGYTREQAVEYDILMFDLRFFYNETTICQAFLPAVFEGKAIFKPTTDNAETIACFDMILQDSIQGSLMTIANVYMMLGLLYQHCLTEFHKQPKNASVKNIIDYIENNYMSTVTMDSLCQECGYTAEHLCRKFKKITGLTPMMYLKLFRLEAARKKLKTQEDSIGNIAAECGFPDTNYFTRCFKAHFGLAPSHYRNEQQTKVNHHPQMNALY